MCLVIEIKSDASLSEAVQILAQHKILSAPVVDVDAPEDASWIDRYIGIVEFAGIVFWLLCQVSMPTNLHENFFFLAKIAWLLQQLIGLTLTLMYNSELAIFTVSKMKI